MKIKITGVPNEIMRQGGFFNPYPYAGSIPSNPFAIINSMNYLTNDSINSTVKAVDEEDANVEAEKGEVLLKFDMGGLFNIKGKRHSEGGTPIVADKGDFIFSRDNNLAITEDEKDLFDLKQTGKYKKSENTPAKILTKEANPKHYNQLLAILDNPKADDFAKKSAEIMLGKYQQKIGQIAYLQEAKKDFPKGIPDFAIGTAPVDAPEFDDVEAKEKMYARSGGAVNTFTTNQVNSLRGRGAWDNNNYWDRIANNLRNFGYTGDNSAGQVQQFVTQQYPELVNYSFDQGYWPNTNKGVQLYGDVPATFLTSEQQLNAFNDNMRGVRSPMLQQKRFRNQQEMDDWTAQYSNIPNTNFYDTRQGDLVNFTEPILDPKIATPPLPGVPSTLNVPTPKGNPLTRLPSPIGDVPKANEKPTPAKNQGNRAFNGMNIPWNAQEMLSTAAPFLSALAQPTYYDMLQQRETPDIRLDRINNQQEVNAIQQQASLAQREIAANTTGKNSQLANAQVRAQALNQIAQSFGNVNNTNTQIANQEDMTNYQAAIRDQDFNLQNIRQTFINNTLSQQRRNEQLTNAATDSLNKGLAIQSGLDALNQNLSAQVMPYIDQYGNSPIVLDPQTRVAISNPNWRGNPLNNPFIGGGNAQQITKDYTEQLNQAILSGDDKLIRAISAAMNVLNKQTRNMPSLLSRMNN